MISNLGLCSFIYSFNKYSLAARSVPGTLWVLGTQEHGKGFALIRLKRYRQVHDRAGRGNRVTLRTGHWSRDLDEVRE